jgi:predicted glycosyl hydrolase (DUF1957 family)
MEGSDRLFLLYTEYANQRFHHHHQKFLKLLWAAKNFNDRNGISIRELEEIKSINSCFQDVNVDYFKKRKI